MCACLFVHAMVEVEVRGQPVGIGFLFLPHGLWGSVLVAGTLPAEPSHKIPDLVERLWMDLK